MHVAASALGRHSHISVKSSIRLLSAWKERSQVPLPSKQPGADRLRQRTQKNQEFRPPPATTCPQGAERGSGAPVGAGRAWVGDISRVTDDGREANDSFTNFVTHSFNKDP